MKDLPIQTTTVQRLRETAIGYNAGYRAGIEAMRDAALREYDEWNTMLQSPDEDKLFDLAEAIKTEADKLIAQTQEEGV